MNRLSRITSYLRHPLALVFFLALLLRIGYLMLMLAQVGTAGLGQSSPDEALYLDAADSVANGLSLESAGVAIFGPGYPVFLGLQVILFGTEAIVLAGAQVFLSSLVALMIGLVAWRLTGKLTIGVIAGILEACSPSSIGLSATFMSEPIFMLLLTTGLLILLRAQRKQGWLGYLLAGVLFAAATLTRGVAVAFVFIVVLFDWLHTIKFGSRGWSEFVGKVSRPIFTMLVVFVGLGFWIAHNKAEKDVANMGMSGPMAMSLVTCLADANGDEAEFIWRYEKFILTTEQLAGDSLSQEALYAERAGDEFTRVLTEKPLTVVSVVVKNAWKLMYSETILPRTQLGALGGPVSETLDASSSVGLNYRITLGVILGMVLLAYRKNIPVAFLAVATWLYFGLLSGMTLWQGPRVFYPSAIGWTLLWAVVAYEIWWAAIGSRRSKPDSGQRSKPSSPKLQPISRTHAPTT